MSFQFLFTVPLANGPLEDREEGPGATQGPQGPPLRSSGSRDLRTEVVGAGRGTTDPGATGSSPPHPRRGPGGGARPGVPPGRTLDPLRPPPGLPLARPGALDLSAPQHWRPSRPRLPLLPE